MAISGTAMRDRLLAKLAQPRPAETWVDALAPSGNRDLLGLIGREAPQSIGSLADLAGRAQPNISRALTALVASGLVETKIEGRRTIPRLTVLGLAKAHELNLLDRPGGPDIHVDEDRLVATVFRDPKNNDPSHDATNGLFELSVWLGRANQASAAVIETDLNEFALRLLADWWRVLYRRDSAWRLGKATLRSSMSDRPVTVFIGSNGRAVQFVLRDMQGEAITLERRGLEAIPRFENALLEAFLRPVARHLRSSGRVDRPLHSLLARLESSRADSEEIAFCRVAGALDMSPYDLSNEIAGDVREVVSTFPDEDARLDFASSLAVDELREQKDWLAAELSQHARSNGLSALGRMRARCAAVGGAVPLQPWRLGRDCARLVRKELKLAPDRNLRGVGDIASVFGADRFALSDRAPGALRGFQTLSSNEPVVLVEDEGPSVSAFTLCRAIGDYVAHGSSAACVADIYTERQAVGRAFAAEFLAPGEGVVHMVEEEGQSVGRIARHFGVGPEVVHRQYNNYSRSEQY